METTRLIKMANDIGAFFEVDKDSAKAAAGVADHIRKFWDPRMRRELLAHLDQRDGEGLKPIVLEALRTHGEELKPAEPTPN
jgi:formate dehydrogenase subunit delta